MPTRLCLNNTAPRESNLIAIINIRKSGDKSINPSNANILSIIFFTMVYMNFIPHMCK